MTINIELKPDEERALTQRARLSGRDVVQYVQKLIRDDIHSLPRSSGQDEAAAEEAAALDASSIMSSSPTARGKSKERTSR
jgi:hypothetical protein